KKRSAQPCRQNEREDAECRHSEIERRCKLLGASAVRHFYRAIRVKFSGLLLVNWPRLHLLIGQTRRLPAIDARLKRLPDPNSFPDHDRVPATKKLPGEYLVEKVRQSPDSKRFERISGTAQTGMRAPTDLTRGSLIANAARA